VRAATPLAATVLTLAGLTAGCGNARQHPPNATSTQRPAKATRLDYPAAGIGFTAPRNWYQSPGGRPLVAVVASGSATIAVWRYHRKEPLPRATSELQQARANLSEWLRSHGRSVHIESAKTIDVNGVRGIQVVASESVSGQRRRVRSTHLFDRGAEVVVDAYAPPAEFGRVDATVFAPLLRSLQLRAPATSGA
jgi:hypothetical protein